MNENKDKRTVLPIMNELRISNDPDWYVECSDEEMYETTGLAKGQLGPETWRPPAQEVVRLFDQLEKGGGVIPLQWTCGGYRPPTPNADEEYETDEDREGSNDPREEGCADGKCENKAGMDDFEFEDENATVTTPRRPLGGQRELKGSARKKTTNFKNILSNMKRHRQMDAAKNAAVSDPEKKEMQS